MIYQLAVAVLKTLPEPWIEAGAKLSEKYAKQLLENGLIERFEDGGYRQSEKGHVWCVSPWPRDVSFQPGTSETLEKDYKRRM